MMHMTFYWGRRVTILFDSWRTQTWTAYALSLVVCFLFAIFYQYLEDRRIRFRLISSSSSKSPPSSVETPLIYRKLTAGGGRWNPAKLAGAVLFGVNSALGYMLMLAIMSFNGGVFIAIVVGLAVGYLVFRSSDDDVVLVDNPCACA